MCETERNDLEDIKLHDENNEVSTKSETIGDINNASTCLVCEYVKVMFDPKNMFFWTMRSLRYAYFGCPVCAYML